MPQPLALPSPADGRQDLSPLVAVAAVCAVYCIPVLAAVHPGSDWDLWWHLRAGQWVVEHRAVTTTDPFSVHGADKPWVAYSWLFEVALYAVHSLLGLTGILLCRVILGLAVVAALHRLVAAREPRFLVATSLAAVAALAVSPLMSERPWLVTILFTTLTLKAVLDLREGRRGWTIWLLPAVYVLWANLHIQFVYGLLVLGLGCAAPVLDRLPRLPRGEHAAAMGSRDWWRLLALTVACGLATLLTPYHVGLYTVVLEYATQPFPFRVVNELTALDFRDLWSWLSLVLALMTAYALGRQARLSSFEVLLVALCAVLGFRARRDVWLIALAALVLLPSVIPSVSGLGGRFTLSRRRAAVAALAVAVVGAGSAAMKGLSEARLRREVAKVFPARAAAVIERRGLRGPLYNDFNWGGYLIWRLPHLPVAMDGRTNLHGEERLQRSRSTWAGMRGWREDPELSGAGLVLAPVCAPLTALLRRDGRFKLVYEDDQAAVFVREEQGERVGAVP